MRSEATLNIAARILGTLADCADKVTRLNGSIDAMEATIDRLLLATIDALGEEVEAYRRISGPIRLPRDAEQPAQLELALEPMDDESVPVHDEPDTEVHVWTCLTFDPCDETPIR